MSENYVELQGVDAKLAQGSELVEWDSETKGFVLNGTAEFEGSSESEQGLFPAFLLCRQKNHGRWNMSAAE